jgi:hypothetical protein
VPRALHPAPQLARPQQRWPAGRHGQETEVKLHRTSSQALHLVTAAVLAVKRGGYLVSISYGLERLTANP